jgi:hypothetical protein
MTDKKPKIVFPTFGYAGFSAYYAPDMTSPKIAENFNFRTRVFYGAAFNLIASFYKHTFATRLSPQDFSIAHHVDDQGQFAMYFGISPTSKINVEAFAEPTDAFLRAIWATINEQELYGVRGEKSGIEDCPIYILRAHHPTDLLQLAENLLKPYDIPLALCDFGNAAKNYVGTTQGFNFEDLYSLPHVRALHNHAIGLSISGHGPHLSH